MRVLLGALLLFGSEGVVWTTAHTFTPLDWAWRALAYALLAGVLLDLAVRYRVRDLYDSMALLALYGLLASVFITPDVSLVEFPRTLLTRTLGGHSLTGIILWGVFGAMLHAGTPKTRLLLVGGVFWLGFFWGVWLRWMPVFGDIFPALPLQAHALPLLGMLAFVGAAWACVRRFPPASPEAFKLAPLTWLLVGVAGTLAFLAHAIATPTYYSLGTLLPTIGVGVVAWAVLWFRRAEKVTILLAGCAPPRPLRTGWLGVAVGAFVLATALAYGLPLIQLGTFNQLWLMEMGFGAVGALWFPFLAGAVAIEGVDAQMRRHEL